MSDEKEEKDPKNLGDLFKKVVNTGLAAAFMTEDAVKNITKDLPLPKEMVNSLVQNAKNSKDEFVVSVKSEVKSFLERIDIQKEIGRIIEDHDIEIIAKIKFTKKDKKAKKKTSKKS